MKDDRLGVRMVGGRGRGIGAMRERGYFTADGTRVFTAKWNVARREDKSLFVV